jgi:hypothetical protein
MEARLMDPDRSELLSDVLAELRELGLVVAVPREARSRHELFQQTSALVLDIALSSADEEPASVRLVVHPPLTRVDVQMVFDEIGEQYHVTGIGIHFDEDEDGRIEAVFTSSSPPPTGVLRTAFQE